MRWIAVLVLLAACAESTSEATVEAPEVRSPTDRRFVRAAEEYVRDLDGRAEGVVVAENEDGYGSDWLVLTPDGQVLLSAGINCDEDGDSTYESDLWQLLDPGDHVSWSEAGGDSRVCSGEIEVVRKLAVTGDEEDEDAER